MINNQQGIRKEYQIAEHINGKKLKEMSSNIASMLQVIFKDANDDSIFKAEKIEGFQKPDIYVECNGEKHYISLKSGSACRVHQENIHSFVKYLRECNIPEDVIETMYYQQWCDGTLDGTGKRRMDYYETNNWLRSRIKRANDVLNANKDFVKKTLYRCLFKGSFDTNTPAEYIYHGDIVHGVLVSREETVIWINIKDWAYMDNLHIGPLTLKPHARYSDVEIVREKSRITLDFKWANMFSDMIYIAEHYRF